MAAPSADINDLVINDDKGKVSERSSSASSFERELNEIKQETSTNRRINNFANSAEEYVSDMVRKGFRLVSHYRLPSYLRDNEYIVASHRPELLCFWECLKSIFAVHSETFNIWTHLIGGIIFICMAFAYLTQPTSEVKWDEKIAFSAFFAGAILCMSFSCVFHTFLCHSRPIERVLKKLDYCGIVVCTVGSFIPWLHLTFFCQPLFYRLYMTMIIILGLICIYVATTDTLVGLADRWIRSVVFMSLGLSAIFPVCHFVMMEGAWSMVKYTTGGWIFVSGALYIMGAVVYGLRVPERLAPGRFDIIFQSHQIMHVFVLAAAFVHYHGISQYAMERRRNICD